MAEQPKRSVLFICLGNICRSPIAAAVFRHVARQKGVENLWRCDSAAIGSWHVGGTMDQRAAQVLAKHGVDTTHKVRQITKEDFRTFDYIFGMDNENMRELKKRAPPDAKASVQLLGSHDPQGRLIIRDPYYDDDIAGFEECYEISLSSCTAFLEKL